MPRYWRRHARETIRFGDGVEALREQGYGIFLEIGPGSVGDSSNWLPSLRRGQGEWRRMLDSLSALYIRGVDVDWAGFDRFVIAWRR